MVHFPPAFIPSSEGKVRHCHCTCFMGAAEWERPSCCAPSPAASGPSFLNQSRAAADLWPCTVGSEHDGRVQRIACGQHQCVRELEREVLATEIGRLPGDLDAEWLNADGECNNELLEQGNSRLPPPKRADQHLGIGACGQDEIICLVSAECRQRAPMVRISRINEGDDHTRVEDN